MKRQVGKIAYGRREYRITHDDSRNEYVVSERWYTEGWHTKTTGKYETLGQAAEAVARTVTALETAYRAHR